jgi:hypothetical protein
LALVGDVIEGLGKKCIRLARYRSARLEWIFYQRNRW